MAIPIESSIQLTNAACNLIFASTTSYITETSAGTLDIYANSVNVMTLTSSGMALTSGAFVDTIETTITDDDTHIPTSGAVVDYLAGLGYGDVSWGTATNQYLVFGSASGDIQSDANLVWDSTDHCLTINGGATDTGELRLQYNSILGLNLTTTSSNNGHITSPNILFLSSSATSPIVVIGDYSSGTTFLSIRDTNSNLTSTVRVANATNTLTFDIRETGVVYIPALGSDDAEDHILAIDDSTGLVTKRSVASLSASLSLFPYIIDDASTNTSIEIAEFRRTTSGTAGDGIGGYITLSVEDDSGSYEVVRIEHVLVDVSAPGSEDSLFQIQSVSAGVLAPIIKMQGNFSTASMGHHAMSIGRSGTAAGNSSVGIGTSTTATGDYSTGVGYWARPTAANTVAIGAQALSSAAGAAAYGYDCVATGGGSIIMGYGSTPTNANANSFKVMFGGTTVLHAGLLMGVRIMSDTDPDTNLTTVVNGTIAYDSTDHQFRAYINGGWTSLSTSTSGASPWTVTSNVISPSVSGDDVRLAVGEQLQFSDATNYFAYNAGDYLSYYQNSVERLRFNNTSTNFISSLGIYATGFTAGFSFVNDGSYFYTNVNSVTSASGLHVTFTSGATSSTNPAHTGGDLTFGSGASVGVGGGRGGNIYFYGGTSVGSTVGQLYFGTGGAGALLAKGSETNVVYYNTTTGLLTYGTSGGVQISGTPANNYVAVWTDGSTIEGNNGLTYNGTDLGINTGGTAVYLGSSSLQAYTTGTFTMYVNVSDAFISAVANGATTLYYNNTGMLATTATGNALYGDLDLVQYGVGTYTGTVAYYLAVDASGNVIEASGGGGVSVANQANNRIVTATATTDALNAEANCSFDGTVMYVSDNLRVGDTGSLIANTVTNYIQVAATGTSESAGIIIVGNNTSDALAVADVSFCNTASAVTNERIALIRAERDGDNDAGKLRFYTANTSGTLTEAIQVTAAQNVLVTGSYLIIGDKTTQYISSFEGTITLAKTGTATNTSIEMGGNQTTDTWVTGFSFHNEASSYTDKRIAQININRFGSNNAGEMLFGIYDSTATYRSGWSLASTRHIFYVAGTAELYLDGTYLRPNTASGLSLGSSSYYYSGLYASVLAMAAKSPNSKSYRLVTNNNSWEEIGVVAESSDIRFKNDIQPILNPMGRLLGLKGITYQYNELGSRITGQSMIGRRASVIAQDLMEVLPEAVMEIADTGYYNIDDRAVCALLVEGVKDHNFEINKLKKEIRELKSIIKNLTK
jgi:hypothetical protein